MAVDSAFFLRQWPAAVLRAHGPDAAAFLQGQSTADLRPFGEGHATRTLWLDTKGKIAAEGHILQTGTEDFLLVSEGTSTAALRERLEQNLIADEVEMEEQTGERELFALWGAGMERGLEALGLAEPEKGRFGQEKEAMVFRAGDGALLVLVPQGGAEGVQESLLQAGLATATVEERETRRIGFNLPAVPGEGGPGEMPQECGLEHLVSYTKGCFLGQEVMARLHHKGHANRALFTVELPAAPATLPLPLYAGQRAAGEVRSAAHVEGKGWRGLAVLKLRALEGHDRLAREADGERDVAFCRVEEETS